MSVVLLLKEFHRSMVHKRRSDLSRRKQLMLDVALITNPAIKKQAIADHEVDEDAVDGAPIVKDIEIPESYMEVYNCRPPPIFIPVVVVAQIITFIIYALEIKKHAETEKWNTLTFTTGLPYWSPLIYDPQRRYQAWRYFTYMLIHQGIFHILFNTIIQLLLGLPLEFSDKGLRVGAVYFFGVVAGSVMSSMIDSSVLLVGSSGGSHALLGAHVALVVMNWKELQHRWLKVNESIARFLFSGCMRLVYALIIVAIDYGVTFYQRYGVSQETTKISFAAHLGGLGMGFFVGLIVLKNVGVLRWERILKWVSLGLVIAFFIIGILFNVFYPGFPAQKWS